MRDVRSRQPLWPLRRRRHAVVACLDDPGELESEAAGVRELGAELVFERGPGPLSAALGRPSVSVASRFGVIGRRGERASVPRVLTEVEALEPACPECGPQAWGDADGF
jgi:hypothetical protein